MPSSPSTDADYTDIDEGSSSEVEKKDAPKTVQKTAAGDTTEDRPTPLGSPAVDVNQFAASVNPGLESFLVGETPSRMTCQASTAGTFSSWLSSEPSLRCG